jgi:pimeloyl-ACP methyl ester carboxylesterase
LQTAPVSGKHTSAGDRALELRAAMGVRTAGQAKGKSKTGWCVVDGCRIAWEQFPASGRPSQPVVCLHAAGVGSREFRPLLNHPPAGTKLIFFDWPGHGRSGNLTGEAKLTVEYGAAILISLLQQLGIEKPVLLGSGFGAAVALRFAADHRDRVLALILSQPGGLVPPVNSGFLAPTDKRGLLRLLRRTRDFAPVASGDEASSAADASRRQILRLAALRKPMQEARAAAKLALERSASSLRTALESLSCPALFALSRNNRQYPLKKYLDLLDPSLAWAPQHKFTVFAGAFHPLWDEPERFSQAVTGFMQALLPLENHTHAWLISAVDYPTRNMNTWKCVHPDCGEERILPVGRNPNESSPRR